MKINLINFIQNKIYKNQEKAQNPIEKNSNKSDFSLAQNIMSNYSKAMISFGAVKKVDKDKLREYILLNPEATQAEIAELFGVSIHSIERTIKRHDIDYSKKDRVGLIINEDELREYIAQNPDKNQVEIAKYFGVVPTTIRTAIMRYNIGYPSKTQTVSTPIITNKDIEKYIKENPDKPLEEIARHFETSVGFIKARMPKQTPKVKAHKTLSVNKDNILAYLKKHPNADIDEVADYFKVTTTYLKPFLRKYDITL